MLCISYFMVQIINSTRLLFTALLLLALWHPLNASESTIPDAVRVSEYNLSKGVLALKGYDPVAYFQGKPAKGSKKISHTHGGVIYRFNNQKNLAAFKEDPVKYEPQFGGWCAWAMYDGGSRAGIDPESYLIFDDKLYVFYDTIIADTRELWLERSKSVMQGKMIGTADRYWEEQTTTKN